jgi:glycerophosphoryl diester phosphodiesterase
LLSIKSPLIIAHRGSSATAPENTIAAFARAFDDGADGVELDVRLASDGVPVVIHDATLQRTGSARSAIAKMTSAQLAESDVGSWFNRAQPLLSREEYTREGIPTLERVFQLVAGREPHKHQIYVELKSDGAAPDLARHVAELINRYRFQERVVVVSFDLDALRQTKLIDSSIRTGALFAPRHGGGIGMRAEKIVGLAMNSGAEEILLHRLIARPKLVGAAIGQGLEVVVWTADDTIWLRRAPDLGVHTLITNDPALFVAKRGLIYSNK